MSGITQNVFEANAAKLITLRNRLLMKAAASTDFETRQKYERLLAEKRIRSELKTRAQEEDNRRLGRLDLVDISVNETMMLNNIQEGFKNLKDLNMLRNRRSNRLTNGNSLKTMEYKGITKFNKAGLSRKQHQQQQQHLIQQQFQPASPSIVPQFAPSYLSMPPLPSPPPNPEAIKQQIPGSNMNNFPPLYSNAASDVSSVHNFRAASISPPKPPDFGLHSENISSHNDLKAMTEQFINSYKAQLQPISANVNRNYSEESPGTTPTMLPTDIEPQLHQLQQQEFIPPEFYIYPVPTNHGILPLNRQDGYPGADQQQRDHNMGISRQKKSKKKKNWQHQEPKLEY